MVPRNDDTRRVWPPEPSFDLTQEGFTLLVMGYTGRDAMQFKVRYIEAFNLMQRALQARDAEMIRGLDPAVIGGVLKAVMGRLIATNAIGISEETARKIFAELIEAREAGEETYHVTKGEISSLELAIKYRAEQHGRRRLVNRFTSRLKAICLNKKLRARKNRLGTWIFPIDVAEEFIEKQGAAWIRDHNSGINGQGVLDFETARRCRHLK